MVTYYEDNHNHELQPLKRHHLRSQRKVSKAKRLMMKNFDDANIPTCKQVRIFESQVGGRIESIGCTTKDIENSKRDERKLVEGHDAETLLLHFKSEKEKNLRSTIFFGKIMKGSLIVVFGLMQKAEEHISILEIV